MYIFNCKGKLLIIDKPIVMGIINVTPDSFYTGSRHADVDAGLFKAEQMINEGASILDIGGQSTRPGSESIRSSEELKRVLPLIEAINFHFPETILSIDTYHSKVASEAVNAGASIVNDISAGNIDEEMLSTVGGLDVPYVCVHMKGTPQNMQQFATYKDVIDEVMNFFNHRIMDCQEAGIKDIIVDPGFGFSKTVHHNLQLLNGLSIFRVLDKPLMVGISRKSIIYKILGSTPEEALNGTTVLNTLGLEGGAQILRVHDVKEAVEAIKLFNAYESGDEYEDEDNLPW